VAFLDAVVKEILVLRDKNYVEECARRANEC
jgi:hypothetical protein